MSRQIRIAWDPIYAHPLPEGHRFPMLKYELIPEQLVHTGIVKADQFFAPLICSEETVLRTHTHEYLNKLLHGGLSAKEQRAIGFPQSPELTQRELIITQGTLDCCYHAFENGLAMNIAGGTHHAFADKGEGFCLLNDFAVAANELLYHKRVQRAMIVDLDVHQGNGTASIFEGIHEVFTFSVHGAGNYPFHKEKSDLDLGLADGVSDTEYLAVLDANLPRLLDEFRPEIVFYLCGVDILATDRFGRFGITAEGCAMRDRYVFESLACRSIPCVAAMGGGYSPNIKDIVNAHCRTFEEGIRAYGLD